MALDMLQVESQFATSWLVPVSGIAATCVGRFIYTHIICLYTQRHINMLSTLSTI